MVCAMANVAWPEFPALVTRGHQVASGRNGDPRFPGGTIAMQSPHFRALGLDLSPFFSGTLNVSLAPLRYRVIRPRLTFRQVRWHPTEPAEDFSFFDVRLRVGDASPWVGGLIYFPHPDTKPAHFQAAGVLELLLPRVEGLGVGTRVTLAVPADQMAIESPEK
jgi:hypothetical protein